MEVELNKAYSDNFLNTYELIQGDPNEVGSKRFRVEPLWKDAALVPPYDSERGTREALRRFLALERKINLVKNTRLKEGYHSSMQKHIDSGMLERFDTYENLKDSFCDAVYDPNDKEELRALSPVHLVLQDKETHKIRTTMDYSGLNILFSKSSNLLPPIHEKLENMCWH